MVNLGIRTGVLDLARSVVDPAATDQDIVDAMRVPPGASLETLLGDELLALDGVLAAWSAASRADTRELFLRNSACKRVLYVSAPLFLPDTIPIHHFIPTGVNTRVHVYAAADVRDTVRLEAISSYTVGRLRFRYALSIQYLTDSVGLGWQLIRPVVAVDPRLLAAARDGGPAGAAALDRVLDALWRLIALGSHDYVHATVLNWFPPLAHLDPAYAAITSERVHPAEVDEWHAASQTALPAGFVPSVATPSIASLELYSLLVHAEVIDRLWDEDPAVGAHVHGLVAELEAALAALVGAVRFGDGSAATEALDYFTTLAGWFLVSALPIGSRRLAEVVAVIPDDRRRRVFERLATVHEGMFDFVRFVDRGHLPWGERFVPVHQVAAEYELALRRPAVRAHLRFLLGPRVAAPAGAPTWLHALAAPLPVEERARLATALADVQAVARSDQLDHALADLDGSGALDRLRAMASGDPDPVVAERAGATAAELRYARAVVAGLVAVVDALAERRARVLT